MTQDISTTFQGKPHAHKLDSIKVAFFFKRKRTWSWLVRKGRGSWRSFRKEKNIKNTVLNSQWIKKYSECLLITQSVLLWSYHKHMYYIWIIFTSSAPLSSPRQTVVLFKSHGCHGHNVTGCTTPYTKPCFLPSVIFKNWVISGL